MMTLKALFPLTNPGCPKNLSTPWMRAARAGWSGQARMLSAYGWSTVAALTLPPVVVAAAALLWIGRVRQGQPST